MKECQCCEREAKYDIVWNGPKPDTGLWQVMGVELRDLCLGCAMEESIKDPGGIVIESSSNLLRKSY